MLGRCPPRGLFVWRNNAIVEDLRRRVSVLRYTKGSLMMDHGGLLRLRMLRTLIL